MINKLFCNLSFASQYMLSAKTCRDEIVDTFPLIECYL